MNQRRLVLQALRDAGLHESADPRVREFVGLLREHSELCWTDLVGRFRTEYYDIYDAVIPALEASSDPLIRNMLIRHADPERPKERQMLTQLARATDFEQDSLAAEQLSGLHIGEIDEIVRRRRPTKGSGEPRPDRRTDEPS